MGVPPRVHCRWREFPHPIAIAIRPRASSLVSTERESTTDWADRIVAARKRRPFTSLEEFARDTGLPKRALILLGRCRCLPLHRARPPRGVVGGAAAARRRAAAAVSGRDRPRAARRERKAAAGDAAAGAGGRRLPDRAAVAEGPPDGVSAREVYEASASSPARTSTTQTTSAASVAPAWCWCGSGRAAPRASSS